jgi:hypothetical protein
VTRQIVVAFRMAPAGLMPGPEGTFLARARSLSARSEALGARMVAWTGRGLALAWDPDTIEEAILLAASIRDEARSAERAWGGGMAEGELESLSPDGQRLHLAAGAALVAAMSLARAAKPGEVLVDGDLRALRAGQLSLLGARTATDGGQRVRGWRLDLEQPWKLGGVEVDSTADATDEYVVATAAFEPESSLPADFPEERISVVPDLDAAATQQLPAVAFAPEEPSAVDVRSLVDASSHPSAAPPSFDAPSLAVRPHDEAVAVRPHDEAVAVRPHDEAVAVRPTAPPSPLVDRVRRLAHGDHDADAIEALADLRRARAAAESGPLAARCQASLALAMTLSIARRPEEALLEALDALARAREGQDAKAVGACKALLAKLYASAGLPDEAAALLKMPT